MSTIWLDIFIASHWLLKTLAQKESQELKEISMQELVLSVLEGAIRNKVVTQILRLTELTHRHTFPSLLTISSPWDSSPSSGRVLFLLIDPVKWPSSDYSFQSKVFSIITNYKWQSLLLEELLCPNLSINQAASQLLHEFHYLELFMSTVKTIKRNLSVQNYTVTLNVSGLKPETESSVEN